MTYEYQCPNGHITERFFRTISAGENANTAVCAECDSLAARIISAPLGFHLYGNPEGYSKPSATKRTSTKAVSGLTGNKSAVG